MSIRVLNWVFEHSDTRLGPRLVLLALADYAHDDGREAYPSYEKLAQKAKLSRKQAIRCCQGLEKDGCIVRYGSTEHGTVKWRVVMDLDEIAQRAAANAHDQIPGFDEAGKAGRDNMSPPNLPPSSKNATGGRDNMSPQDPRDNSGPGPGTIPADRGDNSSQTAPELSPKPSVEPSVVEPSPEPNPQPPSPKGAKTARPGTPRSRGENPRAVAAHGWPVDLAAPAPAHQQQLTRLKDQLQQAVERSAYEIWLADLTIVGVDQADEALVLEHPVPAQQGWVADRFPAVIAKSAAAAGVRARLKAGNDRLPGA